MKVAKGELALALLFAALGALWLVRALGMPLWEGFAPSSGFLPLVYGALLLGLAAAVIAPLVFAPAAADGGSVRKPLIVLAALVLAVAALPLAGFAITIFVLLAFLYGFVERLPWVTSVAVSALTAGTLYLVFKVWLGVPLP